MSDEQIAEWKRLADEATPGNWYGGWFKEAVPALIAEVERLRREDADVKALLRVARRERDEAKARIAELELGQTAADYELGSIRKEAEITRAALDRATAREAVLREALKQAKVKPGACTAYRDGKFYPWAQDQVDAIDLTLAQPSPVAEALLRVVEVARAVRSPEGPHGFLQQTLTAYDAARKGGEK